VAGTSDFEMPLSGRDIVRLGVALLAGKKEGLSERLTIVWPEAPVILEEISN
jgi:hypothetical protein